MVVRIGSGDHHRAVGYATRSAAIWGHPMFPVTTISLSTFPGTYARVLALCRVPHRSTDERATGQRLIPLITLVPAGVDR